MSFAKISVKDNIIVSFDFVKKKFGENNYLTFYNNLIILCSQYSNGSICLTKMSDHEKYKKLWRTRRTQSVIETQSMALNALLKAEKCASVLQSEFNARRVFLIGSLADGFFKASSDIDLVVEGLDDHFYFKALCRLHQVAEDFEVDLIPFEDYKYQDEVLQGGILFDETSGKWKNNPADRYYRERPENIILIADEIDNAMS